MRPRRRLWIRLLASHLAVVVVGSGTVLVAVGIVAPGAFDTAMGHAMTGIGDMNDMMSGLVQTAFREAVQKFGKRKASTELYAAELSDWQRLFDTIVKVKDTYKIMNTAIAMRRIIDLATERLAELEASEPESEEGQTATA